MSESTSLKDLAAQIYQANNAKGFWDYPEEAHEYFIATKLALIGAEVSEALEEWRRDGIDFVVEKFDEELIDILIRTLDLLGYSGVNVDNILNSKLEKNAARPVKHGKAF